MAEGPLTAKRARIIAAGAMPESAQELLMEMNEEILKAARACRLDAYKEVSQSLSDECRIVCVVLRMFGFRANFSLKNGSWILEAHWA